MYVIRPWLYVGKYRETLDLSLLKARGIGAMLQFAELVEHPGIRSLYLAIDDGYPLSQETIRQGINFIHAEHQAGNTILVACGAGISRSVSFAIVALKEIEGLGLFDAYELIRKAHVAALPHMALWKSLCTYYHEDVPYLDMLRAYNNGGMFDS